MVSKKEIDMFVNSQKSIQFYGNVQKSLSTVLSKLSREEYKKITENLILMVLHEKAIGQVMHFSPFNKKFKVLQLTIPKKIPKYVLDYVIAHELGHVMQERNWKENDGEVLEEDADKRAANWGFPKTKKIANWICKYRNE